ncbi:hypothetical protein HZH68_010936 [Vespula germanica]|uniref:Uncharacterized protein n=1 Tax=Vespula germanica TaxID=30212 RepID=A0A834JTL7_VESGE|nr:hypothetical protein HZH68_010936 [Vespula germanica]
MSEADGVDGGAICKRGFTHLQFAEKPEAPEAERRRRTVSPFVSKCSNLHAVGPGLEVLVICENFVGCKITIKASLGWVPWDGPLGVGFCAGLLSVLQNRARFSYSGFGRM